MDGVDEQMGWTNAIGALIVHEQQSN